LSTDYETYAISY